MSDKNSMTGFAYVPAAQGSEGFVELSRTKQGKLFRKHILTKGTLLYPGVAGGKVDIDDEFVAKLTDNFEKGYCPIVQVPKADKNNAHTEDPDRNIGEVVDLKTEGDKIYAYIDARNADDASKLGKTLLGASAYMNLDYTDTKTGDKVGPTLLHVAVTNRPYVTDLEDFEELVAASAEGSGEETVFLTAAPADPQEEITMDKDQLIAELKEKHGIDVAELTARADIGVTLSNKIEELKGSGVIALSAEASSDDVVGAIAALADNNVELTNRVDTLIADNAKAAATAKVDSLVAEGRIIPAQRDAMLDLRLSNAELFDKLVPETKVVALSQEQGNDVEQTEEEVANAEVERIASEYNLTSA